MNPSIHRALLSQAVMSILVKTETVNYHLNTRVLDYSMESISARSSKFPGVYSPEFLKALSRVLIEKFSFSSVSAGEK